MRPLKLFNLGLGMLLSLGCQSERQYDNYNLRTAADINLTENNHPHGYQQKLCFNCHLPENIHRVDRLGLPSFNLAAGQVEQSGLASCAGCHGNNGAP